MSQFHAILRRSNSISHLHNCMSSGGAPYPCRVGRLIPPCHFMGRMGFAHFQSAICDGILIHFLFRTLARVSCLRRDSFDLFHASILVCDVPNFPTFCVWRFPLYCFQMLGICCLSYFRVDIVHGSMCDIAGLALLIL